MAVLAGLAATGCATLQQFAALRNVDFALDRVSSPRLAGVDLSQAGSYGDLAFADVARLALAVTQRNLPMDFLLHLRAENPQENATEARLLRMDWTLFLQDRETLRGLFEEEVLLLPGQPRDVPIRISVNLMDFFEGGVQDMVELALAIGGRGGAPKEVALRASPVVETPLGPIRYPTPITIVSREVGNR